MASKTFTLDIFDKHATHKMLKDLEDYISNLERNCETFVQRLSQEGLLVVEATMASIPNDHPHYKAGDYTVSLTTTQDGEAYKAVISLTGDKVMFVEFSAGITYGEAPGSYPLDAGKAYGYGTYGKGNGNNSHWYYYNPYIGKYIKTHGTASYKPMYKGHQAMVSRLSDIAREVFGGTT